MIVPRKYNSYLKLFCDGNFNTCYFTFSFLMTEHKIDFLNEVDTYVMDGNKLKFVPSFFDYDKRNKENDKILKKELDTLYGEDMFYIEDVKVASFKAGQATEERIQSINAIKAEEIKNAELLKAAKSKKEVMLINAQMIKDVSKETGLSVDQILESELINTIGANSNSSIQPVADVTQVVRKAKP